MCFCLSSFFDAREIEMKCQCSSKKLFFGLLAAVGIGAAAMFGCSTQCSVAHTSGVVMAEPAFVVGDHTMAGIQIEKTFRVSADADTVFAGLTDHHKLVEFSPVPLTVSLDNRGAVVDGGVGCIRTCDLGKMGIIKEKVLYVNADRRVFAYTLEAGNPMGTKNHVAVMRVSEDGLDSLVTWKMYFDHGDLEMVKGQISPLLDGFAAKIKGFYSSAEGM